MTPYQAIVFDGGGVLFACSFDNTFRYWAKVSGNDIREIKGRFVFDEIFQKFERGEIDPATFREHVLNQLGLKMNAKQFDEGWNSIYEEIVPGVERLLRQLRRRYRLVILTNTNEIHAKKWRTRYAPLLEYFERVFSSHEIHARKPEQEAYDIVLAYLRLRPGHVIFLDDNPEFVRGASRIKIASVLVTSLTQMVRELKRLGVQTETAA